MSPVGLGQNTTGAAGARIAALDGVRGMMMILVLISHYFAEIANGLHFLGFGWYAVQMFFILSGFLIGRLIIERKDHVNFFSVFVMRRVCRTFPSYMISIVLIFGVLWIFRNETWTHFTAEFPLWSYLTFTQNIFMAMTGDVGAYWAAPSWTLALEEQLYIVLPLVFFLAPRRSWLRIFIAIALVALVLRTLIFTTGIVGETWGLVMLPARGDVLVAGVIAAVVYKERLVDLARYDLLLRLAPLVMMCTCIVIALIDPSQRLFNIVGPFLIAFGFACFLLAVVRGAPEAKRFEGRFLRFMGDISYCVYLTHLMVLGLMHGLILHAKPSLGGIDQWLVTVAALPVAVALGWAMTTLIESPLTSYGRSWKWSDRKTGSDLAHQGARP
ncbi:MAG: acyltransferase [Rhizobiales bacterium]|nr:acyltransferase [Hyphomicrobiales bacterium]